MPNKITDSHGNSIQTIPTIKGVKPSARQILVELLTPQELLSTQFVIPEGTNGPTVNGAPQGYILEVGALVDKGWGYEKGQRVCMSGGFTPLPEAASKHNDRPLAVVTPEVIKAILLE